ncbi:MAG: response regulator transcription factor [Acidobacteria bacterium]|nr:response regulator transcription factor [Acidobacteriota bacterium]
MIRVLVADDHSVLREGLRSLLCRQADMEVVGEAADGRRAVQFCTQVPTEVVLMDITMPSMNGIEATKRIVESNPDTKVTIPSMHSDESYVRRLLKAGARTCLLKESAQNEVVNAVRSVAVGKSYFSPRVKTILQDDYMRQLDNTGVDDTYELLSPREREILQAIAEGLSNKEMAAQMGLSIYTVETHRRHLLEKLNLHTTADVILYAVRKGLVHQA